MTKEDLIQLANALAFVILIVGDDFYVNVMTKSPAYVLEKYYRYMGKKEREIEYLWGLHPAAFIKLKCYFERWGLELVYPDDWEKGV